MNILIDAIPESILIQGESYRINTDFRNSILFEWLVQDSNYTEKEKIAMAINLYFPITPMVIDTIEGLNEVMEQILWFYRCGKEPITENVENTQPVFCYNFDADYIYSAFLTQYGIDLQKDSLHWWKFRALFKSLNKDNKIMEIMGYRGMKIDSKMAKEQQEFYREMKELYRIPDKRSIEEIEESFNNSMASMF